MMKQSKTKIIERWTCLRNETIKNVANSRAVRRKRRECGFYGLVAQLQALSLRPQGRRENSLHPEL